VNVLRLLPTLTAFSGIVVAGLASGLWTGRWVPSVSIEEATARLADVPFVVGEWTGRDLPVSANEKAAVLASGFVRRRYVNARSGAAVVVMTLCGRPGPMAVHTPEVCYRDTGFEEIGSVCRFEIPGAQDNVLKVRRFQKGLPSPMIVRVFYGWSANGTWESPDNPRWTFARSPVLYKLYAVREMAVPDEPLDSDPAGELLHVLAEPLRTAFFPTS
jgi:hypothetical protein